MSIIEQLIRTSSQAQVLLNRGQIYNKIAYWELRNCLNTGCLMGVTTNKGLAVYLECLIGRKEKQIYKERERDTLIERDRRKWILAITMPS